jgi:hypothetical protein
LSNNSKNIFGIGILYTVERKLKLSNKYFKKEEDVSTELPMQPLNTKEDKEELETTWTTSA